MTERIMSVYGNATVVDRRKYFYFLLKFIIYNNGKFRNLYICVNHQSTDIM
jgi:hypothetical protein